MANITAMGHSLYLMGKNKWGCGKMGVIVNYAVRLLTSEDLVAPKDPRRRHALRPRLSPTPSLLHSLAHSLAHTHSVRSCRSPRMSRRRTRMRSRAVDRFTHRLTRSLALSLAYSPLISHAAFACSSTSINTWHVR